MNTLLLKNERKQNKKLALHSTKTFKFAGTNSSKNNVKENTKQQSL